MKSVRLNKRRIGVIVLVLCCVMQFYRPNKNSQEFATATDFLNLEHAPKEIRVLIKNSCYDCHSNYTNYDWFDNIAPIAWLVDNNVKKGKEVLNFSEWEATELISKKILITAIPFDLHTNKMPKQKYLFMKPKARLTTQEKQRIIDWINEVKSNMIWEE